MTPYEMTLAALAETNPRVHAALAATHPTRSGDPAIGLLGFMWIDGDFHDLVRAADLAHTRAGTEGWDADALAETATYLRENGSWKSLRNKAEVDAAIEAYCHHISTREQP